MSEIDQAAFMRESIRRYGDAIATLSAFRDGLQAKLTDCIEDYEHDLLRLKGEVQPKLYESHRGASRLSIYQKARAKDGRTLVWIELGLWWEDGAVAMFASLWSESNKRHKLTTLPKNHPAVTAQLFGSNRWRLFSKIAPGDDLPTTTKVLLDELALAQ